MRIKYMKVYLRKNRTMLMVAGLLVFGSGCVGALNTTGNQLTEDALKPISVPIREGSKAIDSLKNVNSLQVERQKQIDEIK